jgi:oligoendopeptidase F
MTTLPLRSEIDDQYKWNSPSVFADKAAWEAAIEDLMPKVEAIKQFKGRLAESPAVLADFIEARDTLFRAAMKIFFYAMMDSNCDSTNTEATAMSDKARGVFGMSMAAAAFAAPEMLAIGKETLEQWLADEPRLTFLDHFVDNLFRQQAHVRSADVEQVMGMAQDTFGGINNIFQTLTSADIQFPPAVDADGNEYPVAQSTYTNLIGNEDRELRRSAYDSYTGQYLAFKNTIATTYLTSVKRDVLNMRVRGYGSSLEASLFENNIPMEVHHNLIDTYKKHIPTWHKYWDVRRKILGVDKLHPYDIWAPLSKNQPHVPFEQAVDWICEGMKPLGDDYVAALRKGCLEQRWVDIYPNQGKRQGAFSGGTYDTFPFIMMSYTNSLFSLSTLAHELGHSLHSFNSRKHQPSIYARYTLFEAEVASNFNQAMVRGYLREINDDPAFQMALIEEAMSNFHRYFFIMPTLARFEYEVHNRVEKGMGLTADDLITLCADLFAEGYGDAMDFDREQVGITWATFGHLYRNFYVYQYATGISAANLLAQNILNGGEGAVKNYREFLTLGGSVYPLESLQRAGVDMTTPAAVETTFGVLADMVERLEKLAGK